MVLVKKSKGRQKIEIAKIQDEQSLQVTFSKRRSGLFKKASEVSTLTGAEIVLVVFSPAEKAFSFGSPNMDSVIERFESRIHKPIDVSTRLMEAHHKLNLQHQNKELTILENQLDAEKKIGKAIEQARKAGQIGRWWEAPINELKLEQLECMYCSLLELQKTVKSALKRPMYENSNKNHNLNDGMNLYRIGLFGTNPKENHPATSSGFSQSAPEFGGAAIPPHGFNNFYGGF